jgi:hypothetical protein
MDYRIKPVGKTCTQTGRELRPGDECFSAVFANAGEWERLDFSREAWKGPPPDAAGYWRCRIPAAREVARRTLDPDALLRQFEQLCEEANPARDKLRYVLALFLVQRRRLRNNGTRIEASGSTLELAGLQGEGPFLVPDQQLDDTEVQSLQDELFNLVTTPGD